jgi:hypothetical protein
MTIRSTQSVGSGLLVLADISGYTSFLQAVTYAHRDDAFADGAVPDAYAVISSLLDGIVERLAPPLTLAKLEGDAVFAYEAASDRAPRGQGLLDCLVGCYGAFRDRVDTAHAVWQCWCEACSQIDGLDLKFVVHAGSYVIQDIAGARELVGPEVVIAHRLLKSGAAELVGHGAYALVTRAAVEHAELLADASLPIVETYEHYAPVEARVFPLRQD